MDENRRLSDAVLSAFNQACEQERLDAAELLLQVLELVQTPLDPNLIERRRPAVEPNDDTRRRLAVLSAPRGKAFH
ncbi:MAG: hypothetical protein FJX57_02785 [Alphaproteobacteria bacterium]|nr:hypothetical protein [Alphaproteobacteria bacterium]